MKEAIAAAYEQVQIFNEVAGTLDNPTIDTLDLYNSLGFEELSESITALEEQNAVEVLDGALDEFYIICGKLQILEKMGMNVQEGLRRVCANNASKYVPQGQPLQYDECLVATLNQKHNLWVLRNKEGKVKKHSNFVEVDIVDCVPEGFFKEAHAGELL